MSHTSAHPPMDVVPTLTQGDQEFKLITRQAPTNPSQRQLDADLMTQDLSDSATALRVSRLMD